MSGSLAIRNALLSAGLSDQAVDAAWPSWWTQDLEGDRSGEAELRFELSRKLGLSPRSLMGERVEFVWDDEAFFKNLSAEDEKHRAALTSFGMTIGRHLLRATEAERGVAGLSATALRSAILSSNRFVDLNSLIAACWGLGVPVAHLRLVPLLRKSMHAMVIGAEERQAILLARDAKYKAQAAFTLAHEIGHAALGHLGGAPAIVDMEDPAKLVGGDKEETEADKFALELLTGNPEPDIRIEARRFTGAALAKAVREVGPEHRIDPGTLALCVAHTRDAWPTAMAALKLLYPNQPPSWEHVNLVADSQLRWDLLSDSSSSWVREVMALP